MADLSAALQSGVPDRYVLERELGRGGMATVFLAQDLHHARFVALKVLRAELLASIGADRFLHEIQVTARLDHPHIIPVLDSGTAAGLLWYTMPYVEGETLRDRLPQPVLSGTSYTAHVAIESLEALRLADVQAYRSGLPSGGSRAR